MDLPMNCRAFRGSSCANVERKDSRAPHVRLNNTKYTNVYGALRGEVGGGCSVEGNAALQPKRRAGAANFRRLKCHDGMRVIRTNRASDADLQRLVTGAQRGNCKVSLELGLVLQWALQRCVEFGLALEAIRQAGQVHCKPIEPYAGGVNRAFGVIVATETHRTMCLNRSVRELGMQSQVSAMIGYVDLCFHCGD